MILPQSFCLDPYIPELSNLWFHKKNTQPTRQTEAGFQRKRRLDRWLFLPPLQNTPSFQMLLKYTKLLHRNILKELTTMKRFFKF